MFVQSVTFVEHLFYVGETFYFTWDKSILFLLK